ncbi:MAG TPA: cyclophane-forming radical SAM/SPASM peptide maturase GrrM/OscB [Steroidobacteraceae bacterium]|jgi:uncharacterized protein|nr:cyclophane-forming radical SAM/SPASM peptide maturase GrrM/OscB [Steroidobacteraceae bacterium]
MSQPSKHPDSPTIAVVVVQPTPFCNINCNYCYLPARNNKATMSPDILRTLFAKVFGSGWAEEQLTVIWHAGEPLVMPVEFYEEAFSLIESLRPPQIQVRHSFQTNGMLISKAWCDLFKKWQAGVGVSIDGPRRFNDAHRLARNGRSTFDKTIAGIRLLRSEQVPFHVISVLTDQSLDAPEEMLEFYRAEGIEDVCFNVEESEGAHVSELFASAAPRARFHRFLGRFWREARRDERIRFIREIDGMIPRVFRPEGAELKNVQVEPFAMLNIDYLGNVSSFSPELLGLRNAAYGDFLIGNVLTDSLEAMRAGAVMQAMSRDIRAGVARCRASCEYFSVCGGGAPINKLSENGSFDTDRTGFCALTQMVPTDLILEAFDHLQCGAEGQLLPQLLQEFSVRSAALRPEMTV